MTDMLGGQARLLTVPRFDDDRGALVPIAFPLGDLSPVRSFMVTAPDGTVRGGHGHHKARQLLMRTAGIIEVELRMGDAAEMVTLASSDRLLLVEAGVWARQTYRGQDATLMVFSDRPYEPDDYFTAPQDSFAKAE